VTDAYGMKLTLRLLTSCILLTCLSACGRQDGLPRGAHSTVVVREAHPVSASPVEALTADDMERLRLERRGMIDRPTPLREETDVTKPMSSRWTSQGSP
jgi:hypothetical protein